MEASLDLYVPSINRTLDNITLQYCQVALFEIEGLSREEIPVFSNGLCPDTWSTFGLAIAFLVIYIALLVGSLLGIIWKRNNGFIVARDPVYMVLGSWSTLSFVFLGSIRFLIGRKVFPCALYTFTYFLFPPSMILPITLRCTRAFFLYKLNLLKTTLFESLEKNEKVTKETELKVPSSYRFSASISSSLSDLDNSSSTGKEEIEEDSIHSTVDQKKKLRLLKVYEFLSGRKIMTISYLLAYGFSIGIWLLMGIIEEAVYSNDTNPNKKRVFLIEGGMLVFTVGCSFTITTILVVGVVCLVLLVFEITFLVLLIKSDRDTWNIKKETIVHLTFQFFVGILFIVFSQLHDFDTMIDYIWPYMNLICYYLLIDNVMCSVLPIVYAIRKDRKDAQSNQSNDKVEEKSDLERILGEKKTFDLILDFGRRSYCTESILCYRDIQHYKKLRSISAKKKMALRIINSYLKKDSHYELNLPKVEQRGEELRTIVENKDSSKSGEISRDLFQSIQEHCLNDMKDVFERLKSSNKEIQTLVLSWRNNTVVI